MKVLFLIPAPLNISPSQRFRFEHYLLLLEQNGVACTIQPFWSLHAWGILFNKGHYFLKIAGLVTGFIKRFFVLGGIYRYKFIFIHREVAPIGPPLFEWIISRILRKKIIYDFDDAIWLSWSSTANPGASLVKC